VNKRLVAAFQSILKLPYVPTQSGDHFDTAISEILRKTAKLEALDKPSAKKRKEIFADWKENKAWGYLSQPNGEHSSPDFFLFLRGLGVLEIEVKRSNTGEVMWNSGHPVPGTIYIYNGKTKSGGSTTFVLGDDLITTEEADGLEEVKSRLYDLRKSYIQTCPNNRWSLSHLRPMFTETKEKRWLDHSLRAEREARVFAYLENRTASCLNLEKAILETAHTP
jgi:hypothetical protein